MIETVNPKTIIVYANENGHEPYTDWFNKLKDQKGKSRIEARLRRVETGLYGDYESVGAGVSELRMFFGPGYRVYFGEDAHHIVVLLCGGDKGTQKQDIEAAKDYWRDYQENG